MMVEIHVLQNFAPSCLNRDDTNSPKDCQFGGIRRARISSQCIKRAVRLYFRDAKLLGQDQLAERSKRLIAEVASRLKEKDRPADEAVARTKAALGAVRIGTKEQDETQYLLFLGHGAITGLADTVHEHWDALGGVAVRSATETQEDKDKKDKEKPRSARQKKTEAKEAVPKAVAESVSKILKGDKAADLALFGRMLADQTTLNVDAACQVAHALSTNKVGIETDFYTAVDDLKQRNEAEDAGAGMMGTVEFNSACYYRYANIDLKQLEQNLQKDRPLALKTVEAFLRAFVEAIPTGKQHSMAAQNPPDLVYVVVRDHGLWSLANAFVQPVSPTGKESLVQRSIAALDDYWRKLTDIYGDKSIRARAVCATEPNGLETLKPHRVKGLDALVETVLRALAQVPESKEAP